MKLDNTKLGKRIKVIRKQKNISQMALSEIIDCSPNHLSYIENGNRSISLANFVRLANALGVSADELLMDSLDNTAEAMNHEFLSITADCGEYEKRVLLSILSAVKTAMRENQGLLYAHRPSQITV